MYSDANVQLNLSVGGDVFTRSRFSTPAGYVDPEVGDLKMAVYSTERNGWLLCNGQAVDRTTYAALFAEIGTTFGSGDGFSTFNLPNAVGRVLGNTGGDVYHNLGDSVGSETNALAASNLPSHTHSGTTVAEGNHSHGVNDPGHAHTQTTINDDFNNSGGAGPSFAADSAGSRTWSNIDSSTTGVTIQTNGVHAHAFTTDGGAGLTGAAFGIMQPTLFIGNTFIFSGVATSE
jgi:microcystin-dependent protein